MVASHIHFVIIVLISITIYYFLPKASFKNFALLITSFTFYYLLESNKILILFFIILISYSLGKIIQISKQKKIILLFGIIINVMLLLLHKYILEIELYQRSIPIGLSFYTFQSISYLVDIYKIKNKPNYTILETATFIAFFPKLLAGPLERVEFFINELNKNHSFNSRRMFTAIKIIIFGLFCKFVLADNIGIYVDSSLNDYNTLTSFNILLTAVLYAFQIFFDFYSYSILAIGIAKLYDIKLSFNFNYPYFSLSFYDFWKRWNITLTSWFRDYLYIPLGGNRVSKLLWTQNILIVFVISGLWHGATLNFIVWGFLHGLFYIAERYLCSCLPLNYNSKFAKTLYACTVFFLVSLLWLIFRVENFVVLSNLFQRLFSIFSWEIDIYMLTWFVVISLLILFFKKYKLIETYIFKSKNSLGFIFKEICIVNFMIILLLIFSRSVNSSFIYFKF